MHRFTLFDTALGRCAIAWGPHGIVAVALPDRDDRATRRRILRACPDAADAPAPPAVAAAIEAIVALLEGEAGDLSSVPLDMTGVPEFHRRVYEVAREIGP